MILVDILEIKEYINNMKRLSESVWSDIQDRSNVDIIRKEDDINLLDADGFFEYLNNLQQLNAYIDGNHKDFVSVDDIIFSATKRKRLFLAIEYSSGVADMISLPYSFSIDYKNVYDKMLEEYSLVIPEFETDEEEEDALNTGFIEVHPKDGSPITNKFFLEVLDFILVNCGLKGINESVWSEIQDRSNGDSERKEDSIEHLNRDEFLDYILEHYDLQDVASSIPLKSKTGHTEWFQLPLFIMGYARLHRLTVKFDGIKITKISIDTSVAGCEEFIKPLQDKFKVDTNEGFAPVIITGKNGETTKKICLEILDTVIENAKKPMLKKKEN